MSVAKYKLTRLAVAANRFNAGRIAPKININGLFTQKVYAYICGTRNALHLLSGDVKAKGISNGIVVLLAPAG